MDNYYFRKWHLILLIIILLKLQNTSSANLFNRTSQDTSKNLALPLLNPLQFLRPIFSKFGLNNAESDAPVNLQEGPSNVQDVAFQYNVDNHLSNFFRKPVMFLEYLGNKGAALLGHNGAVFGTGSFNNNNDYPFAYRSLK